MTFMQKIEKMLAADNWREVLSMAGAITMAMATAYVALAEIWGLPNPEHAMQTAKIIVATIGTILGLRTCVKRFQEAEYEKHFIEIDEAASFEDLKKALEEAGVIDASEER